MEICRENIEAPSAPERKSPPVRGSKEMYAIFNGIVRLFYKNPKNFDAMVAEAMGQMTSVGQQIIEKLPSAIQKAEGNMDTNEK